MVAGFCPTNLAFARKNNGFARVRGLQPPNLLAPVAVLGLGQGAQAPKYFFLEPPLPGSYAHVQEWPLANDCMNMRVRSLRSVYLVVYTTDPLPSCMPSHATSSSRHADELIGLFISFFHPFSVDVTTQFYLFFITSTYM